MYSSKVERDIAVSLFLRGGLALLIWVFMGSLVMSASYKDVASIVMMSVSATGMCMGIYLLWKCDKYFQYIQNLSKESEVLFGRYRSILVATIGIMTVSISLSILEVIGGSGRAYLCFGSIFITCLLTAIYNSKGIRYFTASFILAHIVLVSEYPSDDAFTAFYLNAEMIFKDKLL